MMDEVFQSLTASLDAAQVKIWEKQEAEALASRGDAMKIFDLQLQKG